MFGDTFYHDENGTGRVAMGEDGIFYHDESGTTRAMIDADGIGYRDENDNLVWSTTCAPNCQQ